MSTLNFNTTNSTFRQLLGNGLSYRVPPFQRDYSWADDEWDDLWQDIAALFEADAEPSHYMGYLVLQSSDSKKFDIIDGQQRMTTISILVLAALSHLKDLVDSDLDAENNAKRADQLRGSYIGFLDPVTLIPKSKLQLNRHNDRFYQSYLVPLERLPQRNLNASEHQMRKAFGWFKDRLKSRVGMKQESGHDLASFLDQLVDKLFFTVITVTDELNAFKVFETLNARGVRLSATDLLKNYLFSVVNAPGIHDAELKTLEERWEQIVGLLGSESFPEFLRIFWNSSHKLVRKSELFKTIRRNIRSREAAFELIRNLDRAAAVYSALRDPNDPSWHSEERKALRQLSMFNVRQPFAMLLSSHARFFESDRSGFTRILKAIAVISFRYNVICNLQTNEQERVYNEVARGLSDKVLGTPRDAIAALRPIYPDDAQFKGAFSEKELRTTNTRNKKVVRYLLFEIEKQRSGQDFELESAKYDLEHILPEHPSEDWSYIEDSKQDRLMYRIGNMTPLEQKRNRDIGNSDYESKKTAYQQSCFHITRAVADHYETWDEEKIEARQKHLARIAASLWNVDI